jgi:general secretion pathway protein J
VRATASCKFPLLLGATDMAVPAIARRPNHGFTLIEVLVAMLVMSIMALLSWQGIDGMVRANEHNRQRADELAAVHNGLQQWKADLDQMVDSKLSPAPLPAFATSAAKSIDFDGRVLRITRLVSADEVRVVAWGTRGSDGSLASGRKLLRWVSEPVRTRAQWQAAWDQAGRWGQNPSDADRAREVGVLNIEEWQIFYYRNDSWSNPLSESGSESPSSANPDGVRMVLRLATGQLPGGRLTLDWVQPTRGGKA